MGLYVNPNNTSSFMQEVRKKVYVDKSLVIKELLDYLEVFNSKFICVSRPRRFGKTFLSRLLINVFSKGCDSQEIFSNSLIAQEPKYYQYLNTQNVIKIDFISEYTGNKENMFTELNRLIIDELKEEFPSVPLDENMKLGFALSLIHQKLGEKFIFIIDEYDIVVRESANGNISEEFFNAYLDFLVELFIDESRIDPYTFVYLTGILPIVKDKIQSKLTNFSESSMLSPLFLAPFIGFTSSEVEDICNKNNIDYKLCKHWYDGYKLNGYDIYAPTDIIECVKENKIRNYWANTSTYRVVSDLINMNFDGTKDSVNKLIINEKVSINVASYSNSMTNFSSLDDVFTYLIHTGYLSYDENEQVCYIPNNEVREEWKNAIRLMDNISEPISL